MKKKPLITILIKSLSHGGAEKVCTTLSNEFINRNYEVTLWILDYKYTSLAQQLNPGVKIINLKKRNVRKSVFQLINLFVRHKPERLLVFNFELAVLAIAIKKMFFLRTSIIFRSINTLSGAFQFPKTVWERYFAIRVIKFILPFCDKIIAQSTGMREDLIHNFNIAEHKIVTIPNPAVNLLHENGKTVINMHTANYFLFVGRLQAQKGLVNLIRIFAKAHHEQPDIQLIIVGEGPEEKKLKELTNGLKLNQSIHFEGYQPQTYSYFEYAKATLLTSLYEGFPNVLVESVAAGTPVIAFNCPSGPEDIIVPGVNGILVPNQDDDAFVQALLSIARDEIRFNRQEIMKTSERFSVQNVVDKYEKVLSVA